MTELLTMATMVAASRSGGDTTRKGIYACLIIALTFCGSQFQESIRVLRYGDSWETFKFDTASPVLRRSVDFEVKTNSYMRATTTTVKTIPHIAYPRVVVYNLADQQQEVVHNSLQEWVVPFPTRKISHKKPKYDKFLDESADSEGESHDIKQLNKYAPKAQYSPPNDPFHKDCKPMKEWQTQSFPVCNTIHELQTTQHLQYLGAGGWRYTFAHEQHPDLVMKLFTLEDDYDYDPRSYEIHRVDALVSERLTSSDYIMDVYGYCALTSLYERATTTLSKVAHATTSPDGTLVSPLTISQKIRYSYQVAHAMSDLHGFDYPSGLVVA